MNLSQAGPAPLVSVITLNYNQAAVTREFLESSRRLLYPNYEILVCDMASDVDPGTVFNAADYPNTRLLKSGKNLGFAGGNNWAMRQAKGDFFFIVNNDTELTPDLIGQLLAPFAENPAIAVTCPKIKYFSQPDTIQYAGFNPMNPVTGRTSTIGDLEKDHGQYDRPGPTFGAHGCAMMVSRSVVEKTGMFPEKFFLYYEEWDWSARIRKAGFIIWYTAGATIYHKESMTVGKENPMKAYYHTRNRILYMRRNSSPLQLAGFSAFFAVVAMPKAIAGYLAHRQFPQLRNFLKGVGYNLTHSSSSTV